MKETSKAMRRRWVEDAKGLFPWKEIFKGKGIDVGAGDDPLPFEDCIAFDQKDGDANKLDTYFKEGQFDYVHGSQVIEHLVDPVIGLNSWLKTVKKGGYVVASMPCFTLYEGMIWPSRYNPDHRSSWSMWLKDSPAPIHCLLPDWLNQFPVEILLCRLVDTNYNYKIGTSKDQTFVADEGVECWNEFCIRKK